MQWQELAERVLPILGFLLCLTVVAELADFAGVFAVLANRMAIVARGSVVRLWMLTALLAVASTAVLSLDTTAVLLTPVVLALATQLELDRALFAYTTVWLANTASLVLPVSNLTNLLALDVLHLDAPGFVRLMWPVATSAILVTVVALAVLFRRSLGGRYPAAPAVEVLDRPLLAVAMVVCVLLGPAIAVGVDVTYASAVAALILVASCVLRAPQLLSPKMVPWALIGGAGALFVVVQIAHDHGLTRLLVVAAGAGDGTGDLFRLVGISALGANLVDNLPSYLAMEPVAQGDPVRMAALLLGVNAGPLITPWASVATLLWAGRCRAAGIGVSWGTFALRGLVLVPVLLAAGALALSVSR